MKPDKQCPYCQTKDSIIILEDDTWEYQDRNRRSFSVPDITCFYCEECGEKYIGPEADKLNQPKIQDARRLSESLLSGSEIKAIVEKVKITYGFSETQLENILGIGAKSFTRWKHGSVCQSNTADALLRAIDKYPSILMEIAEVRGVGTVPKKRGRRKLAQA